MVGMVVNQLNEQCMKNSTLDYASSVFLNFIRYRIIIFFKFYSLFVTTKNIVKLIIMIPFMLLNLSHALKMNIFNK